MESCPLVISHILAEFHPERSTYTTLHITSLKWIIQICSNFYYWVCKIAFYTLLKSKRHSLRCHDFLVHTYLLRMCTNVVDFRVMWRLCRREWNWQRNWQSVNQHSWDPWQWTTWSRRVTSDFNSVFTQSTLLFWETSPLIIGAHLLSERFDLLKSETHLRRRSLAWPCFSLMPIAHVLHTSVLHSIFIWIIAEKLNIMQISILGQECTFHSLWPFTNLWRKMCSNLLSIHA